MKFNMADARKRAEAQGLLGKGSYFKLQEGANKIRVVSEFLEHPGEFNGKPTFKWLCYVIDRKDTGKEMPDGTKEFPTGKIKPFFMAHTIYKQIEALQEDPDYVFDEVPMPYDITINAKGAGDIKVEYNTVAARTNTPLTPAEKALLVGIQPLAELQQALNDKQPASTQEDGGTDDDSGPDIEVGMHS